MAILQKKSYIIYDEKRDVFRFFDRRFKIHGK